MLGIGDKVPAVLGKNQQGEILTSASLAGRRWILYFYPKDNTSGCTAQACSLRDGYSELMAAGYPIVGVSVDNEKSHQKFIEKYALPFPLISDTDKELVSTFGVWIEKSMYGRKYMGTLRSTFVIDEQGTIVYSLEGKDIQTSKHAEQLIKVLIK